MAGALRSHVARRRGQLVGLGRRRRRPPGSVLPDDGLRLWRRRLCRLLCWRCLLCLLGLLLLLLLLLLLVVVLLLLLLLLRPLPHQRGSCLHKLQTHL